MNSQQNLVEGVLFLSRGQEVAYNRFFLLSVHFSENL